MEIIKLNLIPSGAIPVVHVKQYDIGREWRFELYEGAAVYTLDGTEVLECDVNKLDGNIVTIAVTNTSSTYVDIATTVQMTACSGDQLGALRITKGGDDIATINFILACQRSPLEGGITSDSAIHNLEQQIADAVADQYDADSVVFDNTPTTGHGIGYAVTSDGLKSYIPKNVSDMDDVTITAPTDGDILVYNNGVWENQANPASTANFGPDYDENTTYNTGDKVIYQGLFYVCNDDNVTGTWDATKWDAFTVADLNGKNIPMSTTDTDKVADRIEALENNFTLSGLNDTVITSPQAYQMLQYANVGGQLKIVNTSRNAIRHTTVSGTTDGTGDILCSDLPLANYQILSAYKNRTISGQNAVGYCILGGNNQTHPYIHVIKSDNTILASTAVTIEVYYVEI